MNIIPGTSIYYCTFRYLLLPTKRTFCLRSYSFTLQQAHPTLSKITSSIRRTGYLVFFFFHFRTFFRGAYSFLSFVSSLCLLSFFFQAEDGIRDPLWSRGLGDVYKRQVFFFSIFVLFFGVLIRFSLSFLLFVS